MTVDSDIVTDSFDKIRQFETGPYKGGFFAACGSVGEGTRVFRMYSDEGVEKFDYKDFAALMWFDGHMYEIDSTVAPYNVPSPWAIGTGAPFALMAMKLYKKSAIQAVKDAIKMDSASGGEIFSVVLSE